MKFILLVIVPENHSYKHCGNERPNPVHPVIGPVVSHHCRTEGSGRVQTGTRHPTPDPIEREKAQRSKTQMCYTPGTTDFAFRLCHEPDVSLQYTDKGCQYTSVSSWWGMWAKCIKWHFGIMQHQFVLVKHHSYKCWYICLDLKWNNQGCATLPNPSIYC